MFLPTVTKLSRRPCHRVLGGGGLWCVRNRETLGGETPTAEETGSAPLQSNSRSLLVSEARRDTVRGREGRAVLSTHWLGLSV
jgi:hypothetical protein